MGKTKGPLLGSDNQDLLCEVFIGERRLTTTSQMVPLFLGWHNFLGVLSNYIWQMLSPSVRERKHTVVLWLLWIFCHFSLILVCKTCLLCLGLNMRGKRGSKLQKIQHWWWNQEEELEHRFSQCLKFALRQRKTSGQNTSCCATPV